jgi:ADP-heptose:LPS heptosyltransferase
VKLFKYVQRKAALGDVLWIEPVIRKLAAEYTKVIVVTPFMEVFRNYPLKNVTFKKEYNPLEKIIREISRVFFKSAGFLNLGGVYETSPMMHIARAYFIKAGYPEEPLSNPQLHLSADEMKKLPVTPYIVMHLQAYSSQKKNRSVHGVDWKRIKEHVESRGLRVIGIGNHTQENAFSTQFVNPTLRELIAYIRGCVFFIGLDSGPSHIAAAFNRPALVFFGSVTPEYRLLLDRFTGKVMQKPCVYAGCYHSATDGSERKCKMVDAAGSPPCCTFTTSEVMSAVDSFIDGSYERKRVGNWSTT